MIAPVATLFDAASDIASQKARYQQAAGRASILREAVRRAEAEIGGIHRAVDSEEDGAEVLLERLPAARANLDRVAAALEPWERQEKDSANSLRSYGFEL